MNARLRELPSVDEVLRKLDPRWPPELATAETRRVIEAAREKILAGTDIDISAIPGQVARSLEALERPSLRRVINATGVVLHTNLGRAPLAPFSPIEGYSNLEYDLGTGKRGKRDAHAGPLLERLLGRPGIVVNNGAAAVYLTLNELAAGGEAIVSRGELIEIGDGFRIPDIMTRSGAILREVGTTNRTRVEDYRDAITDRTRLIMLVHPSNFHISGFTAKPDRAAVAALGRERGIPVYEDLGSGCVVNLKPWGIHEPMVTDCLSAGVSLVSFSGDKLLGGPQAGIIAGDPDLVQRLRRNPMFRALRCDKMIHASLEGTLRSLLLRRWDDIPALRMISLTSERLHQRAEAFRHKLAGIVDAESIAGESVIGGGSTPDQALPTYLVALKLAKQSVTGFEKKLRAGDPAVVARIEDDRLVLDLRTVFESDEDALLAAIRRAQDTSLRTSTRG